MRELSPLQVRALHYASAGHTDTQTAFLLGKSRENVKRALRVARSKLGASTTAEAVELAKSEGYSLVASPLPRAPRAAVWERDWECGAEFVEHYRGAPWCDVPPHEDEEHGCVAQTRGMVRVTGLPLMRIERCACGAANLGHGWIDRNSRVH